LYLKSAENMPRYLPLPRFLLGLPLSPLSKLAYALILSLAGLSLKNGWKDELGAAYVIYPEAKLASDLGCSERTVRSGLRELEEAGLLERRRQGRGKANKLFPRVPEERQISAGHPGKDRRGDRQDPSAQERQNLPPNKNKEKQDRNTGEKKGARAPAVYEYDERYCFWIK